MSEHAHEPGKFPEVHDEAPRTPTWVPVIGLALLGLIALFGVYRAATAPEEPREVGQVAGEAEPAAEPPPAAAPPAEAAPAPGGADAHGRQPGDEHFGHGHD